MIFLLLFYYWQLHSFCCEKVMCMFDVLNHFLAAAYYLWFHLFLCLYGSSQTCYLILLFPGLSFCPGHYNGSPLSRMVYSCIFRWAVSSYFVLFKPSLFTPCVVSCNIILTMKGTMNHHTIILYILFTIF